MATLILLCLMFLHLASAADTCMAGAPLSPQQAAGNGTAARPRTVLSSAAEFKSLLRSGGPVLALFVQRRCPLSRLFWPTFVAASERFPHVRFVAVDVEFEYSLNAQLGIGAVPHVSSRGCAHPPCKAAPALHSPPTPIPPVRGMPPAGDLRDRARQR